MECKLIKYKKYKGAVIVRFYIPINRGTRNQVMQEIIIGDTELPLLYSTLKEYFND